MLLMRLLRTGAFPKQSGGTNNEKKSLYVGVSYDIDMLGFSVFHNVSPIDLKTVEIRFWHQSKTQSCNDCYLIFRFLASNQFVSI